MVKIAGLWEFGWNTPLLELDLWEYPLRDFSIKEFYMSPVTGILSNYVTEVHDIGVLIEKERKNGTVIVFVDEKGTTELQNFKHPENVLYVFGKATISSMQTYYKDGDLSLVIKTPNDSGLLWPHQCVSIVLYDRMLK